MPGDIQGVRHRNDTETSRSCTLPAGHFRYVPRGEYTKESHPMRSAPVRRLAVTLAISCIGRLAVAQTPAPAAPMPPAAAAPMPPAEASPPPPPPAPPILIAPEPPP